MGVPAKNQGQPELANVAMVDRVKDALKLRVPISKRVATPFKIIVTPIRILEK